MAHVCFLLVVRRSPSFSLHDCLIFVAPLYVQLFCHELLTWNDNNNQIFDCYENSGNNIYNIYKIMSSFFLRIWLRSWTGCKPRTFCGALVPSSGQKLYWPLCLYVCRYKDKRYLVDDNCYLDSFASQLSSTGGGSGVLMVLVLMSPMRTRASLRAWYILSISSLRCACSADSSIRLLWSPATYR